MGGKLDCGLPGTGRSALKRGATAAFGVLAILLNLLAGFLSGAGTARGLAFLQDGELVICTGGEMLLLGTDGNIVPSEPGKPLHQQHECPCCLVMHASAVLPRLPAALTPADLASIQLMRPGAAQHYRTAAISTARNRGPPRQA